MVSFIFTEGECDVIVVDETNSSILTGAPHESTAASSVKVIS